MIAIGQAVGGLSPIAQVVGIMCLFLLIVLILMIVFMIVIDNKKMQTATKGASQITKLFAQMRKKKVAKEPPDSSVV
ncbi:MAG: hypothetical protein ACRDHZ_03345 [Ktedonobacteraceae bacterium]